MKRAVDKNHGERLSRYSGPLLIISIGVAKKAKGVRYQRGGGRRRSQKLGRFSAA